jgi:hypothetical protein
MTINVVPPASGGFDPSKPLVIHTSTDVVPLTINSTASFEADLVHVNTGFNGNTGDVLNLTYDGRLSLAGCVSVKACGSVGPPTFGATLFIDPSNGSLKVIFAGGTVVVLASP